MLDILARFNHWLRGDALNLAKILVVAALLIRVLRGAVSRLLALVKKEPLTLVREQQIQTMMAVVNSLGFVVIVSIAGMMALREVGLDVRPILAGAGLLGLAVGFGAQHVVKDVITGFFILMENQYGIGDVVRISGIQGTVEQMTLRRTVIRDGDGVHNIPNGQITSVANLSRGWSQVSLRVPVGASEQVDRVTEVLRAAGREMAEDAALEGLVLEKGIRVLGVESLAGSQMELLVQMRVAPGKQFDVSRELRRRIQIAFERAGIRLSDPQVVRLVDSHSPGPPP